MSGRLSAVEAQIDSARQLQTVVTAMRGIAAVRAREAENHLAGIRAAAATVAIAIGDVLRTGEDGQPAPANRPANRPHEPDRLLAIAMGTEQGFVGTLNDQILAAAKGELDATPGELIVTGTRGAATASERGLSVAWSTPMVTRADDVTGFASDLIDEFYRRLNHAGVTRVSLIHAAPGPSARIEIVQRQLIPFDFARFHLASRRPAPLLTLPIDKLLAGLAEAYVYTGLCEAAALSLAAENEARVRAMTGAHANLRGRLDTLTQRYREVRQEEITSDIVELTAGAAPGARGT